MKDIKILILKELFRKENDLKIYICQKFEHCLGFT